MSVENGRVIVVLVFVLAETSTFLPFYLFLSVPLDAFIFLLFYLTR